MFSGSGAPPSRAAPGELAPSLSEASMEVAESSLALAARHAAVPCALLLTDVALSMTLEASRLQLTGKSLLDTWQMPWVC